LHYINQDLIIESETNENVTGGVGKPIIFVSFGMPSAKSYHPHIIWCHTLMSKQRLVKEGRKSIFKTEYK